MDTFLHVFCRCDSFLDLFLILETGLGFEGFTEAIAEVVVAEWVFSSEVEEFCRVVNTDIVTACLERDTFVYSDHVITKMVRCHPALPVIVE